IIFGLFGSPAYGQIIIAEGTGPVQVCHSVISRLFFRQSTTRHTVNDYTPIPKGLCPPHVPVVFVYQQCVLRSGSCFPNPLGGSPTPPFGRVKGNARLLAIISPFGRYNHYAICTPGS